MYPNIHIGSLTVPTYQVNAVLIFIVALLMAISIGRKRGIPLSFVFYGWLLTIPLGLLGARLLYVILHPEFFFNDPLYIFNFGHGGYVSYGAYLLGVMVGFLLMRLKKPGYSDTWLIADIFLPCIIVGHMLWRGLGCFMAGCCHGKPAYGFPLAVTFNHPSSGCIYKGIPVHPTQLYEAAGGIVMLYVALYLRKRATFKGQVLWTCFLLYGIFRFFMEFLRGDIRPMVTEYLSVYQAISLFVIFFSTGILFRWRKKYPLEKEGLLNWTWAISPKVDLSE